MTREVTSAKVAAIAGRVLKRLKDSDGFGSVRCLGWLDGVGSDADLIRLCAVDELKAVCASALTQRPDKKARKR